MCFKGFITFTRNMEKKGIAGKGLIAQTVQERICKVDTVFLRVIKKNNRGIWSGSNEGSNGFEGEKNHASLFSVYIFVVILFSPYL